MKVTVYTKPSCPGCKLTQKKLTQLDIEYDSVQMTPADVEKFLAQDLRSAPVVEVDLGGGAVWRWGGYAPSQIEILDHIFGCDDPVCDRCESAVAA